MVKKYKVEIPEMIKSHDAETLTWLTQYARWVHPGYGLKKLIIDEDFDNIKYFEETGDSGGYVYFEDIPKKWIKEIKEPTTFEEKILDRFKGKFLDELIKENFSFDDLADIHYWTIENERLKH